MRRSIGQVAEVEWRWGWSGGVGSWLGDGWFGWKVGGKGWEVAVAGGDVARWWWSGTRMTECERRVKI